MTTRWPPATPSGCSADGRARPRRRGREVEGRGRRGDRRVRLEPGAGHRPSARRGRAEEGRAAREGGREGRRPLLCRHVQARPPGWVAEQFELLGAQADRDACRTLVSIVGDDLDELASEIAEARRLGRRGSRSARRTSRASSAARPETPAFALTDAWGRRDLVALLEATESLLERGDARRALSPSSRDTSRASARAARSTTRACRPREAAGRLKMHPFAAEKAFVHARNYSDDELRAATVRLAEIDVALKGGSRLAGELELERALVEITRPSGGAVAAARLGGRRARRRAAPPGPSCGRPCCGGTPLRRRAVDPADELAVLGVDLRRVAVVHRALRRRWSVLTVERKRRFSSRCRAATGRASPVALIFGIA